MKVKVSRAELKECMMKGIKRAINESKRMNYNDGAIKASKKANRDIERETFGDGFKSYNKVHKSEKQYNRKGKNKFDKNNIPLDEGIFDFNSPEDDNYYDDGYEIEAPDINDIVGKEDFKGEEEVTLITIKTDIDKNESELISSILDRFEDAEQDVVNGNISFVIPKQERGKFIGFLRDNDVNILKK